LRFRLAKNNRIHVALDEPAEILLNASVEGEYLKMNEGRLNDHAGS